jgi:hypothetical protein
VAGYGGKAHATLDRVLHCVGERKWQCSFEHLVRSCGKHHGDRRYHDVVCAVHQALQESAAQLWLLWALVLAQHPAQPKGKETQARLGFADLLFSAAWIVPPDSRFDRLQCFVDQRASRRGRFVPQGIKEPWQARSRELLQRLNLVTAERLARLGAERLPEALILRQFLHD